jgi:hypothetical protein
MSRAAVVQDACVNKHERNDGRGRDEPIKPHGNLMTPRRQNRARDGRKLAPAQR